MTDRELDDFIKFGEENIVQNGYMIGGGWAKHAITIAKALREHLSQPEPEPLVWMNKYGHVSTNKSEEYNDPLYLAPPKRKWVGLTDEEIWGLVAFEGASLADLVKHIEAKLKEKNT